MTAGPTNEAADRLKRRAPAFVPVRGTSEGAATNPLYRGSWSLGLRGAAMIEL